MRQHFKFGGLFGEADSEYGQYLFDQYHYAYASDSLYVHAAERVIADYIVHDERICACANPNTAANRQCR